MPAAIPRGVDFVVQAVSAAHVGIMPLCHALVALTLSVILSAGTVPVASASVSGWFVDPITVKIPHTQHTQLASTSEKVSGCIMGEHAHTEHAPGKKAPKPCSLAHAGPRATDNLN